jgi:hypothetical protein
MAEDQRAGCAEWINLRIHERFRLITCRRDGDSHAVHVGGWANRVTVWRWSPRSDESAS